MCRAGEELKTERKIEQTESQGGEEGSAESQKNKEEEKKYPQDRKWNNREKERESRVGEAEDVLFKAGRPEE